MPGEAPRADGERKRRRRRRRGGRGGSGEARPEAALAGVAVAESLLEADEGDESEESYAGDAAGAEPAGVPADAETAARLADTQPLPILASTAESLAPLRPESPVGPPTLTTAAGVQALPGARPHPHADTEASGVPGTAEPPVEAPLEEILSAIGTESGETTVEVPALATGEAEAGFERSTETRAEGVAELNVGRDDEPSASDTAETAAGESPAEEAPRPKPTYTVWSSSD